MHRWECFVTHNDFIDHGFQGFDEAEIQKKINEYRKLLQSQVASGELDIDAEMDNRDTHVRAKAAIENRDRMRSALGIKDDFVDGTSFEKFVFFLFFSLFSHKRLRFKFNVSPCCEM